MSELWAGCPKLVHATPYNRNFTYIVCKLLGLFYTVCYYNFFFIINLFQMSIMQQRKKATWQVLWGKFNVSIVVIRFAYNRVLHHRSTIKIAIWYTHVVIIMFALDTCTARLGGTGRHQIWNKKFWGRPLFNHVVFFCLFFSESLKV